MRIFEDTETWGGKINFIDEADTLVGFDAYQSCCESFGHFFTDKLEKIDDPESYATDFRDVGKPEDLEELFFDVDFFEEFSDDYGGGEVAFRLFNPNKVDREPIFLILYNHHNGYYSHGFSMKTGGTVIRDGGI